MCINPVCVLLACVMCQCVCDCALVSHVNHGFTTIFGEPGWHMIPWSSLLLFSDEVWSKHLVQSWGLYRLSPKNYNQHLGIDCERTLMESEKSNRIMNLWIFFFTIWWRPHLIWPSSHKEIWIFVKEVIGPFLPSFVTNVRGSQKTGLQTYSNFMHTFLTKVVPDNLKPVRYAKSCKYHLSQRSGSVIR